MCPCAGRKESMQGLQQSAAGLQRTALNAYVCAHNHMPAGKCAPACKQGSYVHTSRQGTEACWQGLQQPAAHLHVRARAHTHTHSHTRTHTRTRAHTHTLTHTHTYTVTHTHTTLHAGSLFLFISFCMQRATWSQSVGSVGAQPVPS